MKKFVPLFFAPIFLLGCKGNSALSDVEVTDPGLISPEIVLSEHVNENGRKNTNLVVFLNDKNNDGINLLKGGVTLNNTPLSVQTEMGGAPYYTLGNVKIIPNTKYSFMVTLADDQSYPCVVTSPKGSISGLSVPEYHNMNKPLKITWNKFRPDQGSDVRLTISCDEAQETEVTLSSQDARNGHYTFSSGTLRSINEGERSDCIVTLTSSVSGKVDPKFNGGSVQIVHSVSKQVTLDKGDSAMGSENDEGVENYQHEGDQKEKNDEGASGYSWWKIILMLLGGGAIGFGISHWARKK